ncbi:MAG: hypothetical protein ACR2QB_10470 [Gammaproteobacteria bacterium]
MNPDPDALIQYLTKDSQRLVPPALAVLTDALQSHFGQSLVAVLFYGSCMRTGQVRDAVVDLHVIIDDYGAYNSPLLAVLNRIIAPNVFYLSAQSEGMEVRAKYNVFALEHLRRLVGPRRLAVFSWARLAQRAAVLYSRDSASLDQVQAIRAQAVRTFAQAAGPLCAPPSQGALFWQEALQLTFASELRAESADRAAQLVAQDADYFEAVAAQLPDTRPPGGPTRAKLAWGLRAVVGKPGSVLRLLKGWYTFDGGLDYLVWKLERHSGQQIEIPPQVRARPVLHIWGFAWRLYRDGVFR